MRFSERLGYKPIKQELQFEVIDTDLKNTLWTIFLDGFFNKLEDRPYQGKRELYGYTYSLWLNFFKLPIDSAPIHSDKSVSRDMVKKHIREFFFSTKTNWYEIYDLLEFSGKYTKGEYYEIFNKILEREKAGYRFLKSQIVPITSKEEIEEIEEAISSNDTFKSVKTHLQTSLKLLSDKQSPDYRNSIKESISAIESMCKIFTDDEKSTLGQTLKKLELEGHLHPALKKAFSMLYGYTSDDGGIRHALTETDREIDFYEAKFMLATCSAFINYLKSKM
ncbi:AbiJ-NTD4 domain-containing protein [Algibacter lectus]|uniref:HEPN AbiJ-N-terminal domain-containing protein n=1 Tax=Algibacter lectus TaxID=221126 RepID=A0A4R8M743_9FLAO|nr:hypothetical protein [Algibacter lectus]MWW25723.1 hypothetical protein [Algibacter lectus]TDY61004.1 hypothetical protein DFQ06_3013 [Algibacter lectus]